MHKFKGKWITNSEFCAITPRNVFHRQLDKVDLPCNEHRNRHILFRKKFEVSGNIDSAKIFISADDYYKLYINGRFVSQGPAPSYHFNYNCNVIDVSDYLVNGKNLIAVHTLYQGLINRVWQSGDDRHGLILDLIVNGKCLVCSDESFKTAYHTAYREIGTVGYDTQFLEDYDSNAPEVGFELTDFDDSSWQNACYKQHCDYTLTDQKTSQLVFEKIVPKVKHEQSNIVFLDFGSNYVGYLCLSVRGKAGDTAVIRCAQELNSDGTLCYNLRANCIYQENFILRNNISTLDQFDYKSFRYAEIVLPDGCEIVDAYLIARHYPFKLNCRIKPEYASDENLQSIWQLCINTQKYGVQEVIQDCMEREKGFYVGDGCYTALTNMILTGDDGIVRKLIDDAFASSFITDSLVTCLNCSFMQEIAEYPLMLIYLVLWHYRLTGNKEYLAQNYPNVISLLEVYRRDYEHNYLLSNLDKWCVVEWPANFRHGYDVDITEGEVCSTPHIAINAYYIEAVKTANAIANILDLNAYRDEKPLLKAFTKAFYDEDKCLFKDSTQTSHISLVGNIFPLAFNLTPSEKCTQNIINMLLNKGVSSLSLFCSFPALEALVRHGKHELIPMLLKDEGAWLRMLKEGATTTFEGWGKDTKWNTSLFHLTLSYAAVFLSDIDLDNIFNY